jgi:hypothetical protein
MAPNAKLKGLEVSKIGKVYMSKKWDSCENTFKD